MPAIEMGTPVVLDAVGTGATKLRTKSALRIIEEVKLSVLRGNAGEIATLAGANAEVRGVESMGVPSNVLEIAERLAEKYGFTVAVTGKEDIVTDGKRTVRVLNGHWMMGRVRGNRMYGS
ncbi:MAG: hydroxyethylthiazole kinase [Candidatus Heimdallarchaeaceae archaeon]